LIFGQPIFEIAVYKKSPEELHAEYDAAETKYLRSLEPQYPMIQTDSPKYTGFRFLRNQFWEKYGEPYPYNRAIGWLILIAQRDQVLAEYYKVTKKRLSRTGARNRVSWQGKCFAVYVAGNETSKEIIAAILQELHLLTTDSPFRGRYLDTTAFMQIAPYINWRRLIRESV
jgi:hypothetical protein